MEGVVVWEVLVVVLIPSYCGGFLLLWGRQNTLTETFQKELIRLKEDQNKIWEAINKDNQELLKTQLINEKHFLRRDSMNDIKKDIITHIDTLGKSLHDRVVRVEGDIDKLKGVGNG